MRNTRLSLFATSSFEEKWADDGSEQQHPPLSPPDLLDGWSASCRQDAGHLHAALALALPQAGLRPLLFPHRTKSINNQDPRARAAWCVGCGTLSPLDRTHFGLADCGSPAGPAAGSPVQSSFGHDLRGPEPGMQGERSVGWSRPRATRALFPTRPPTPPERSSWTSRTCPLHPEDPSSQHGHSLELA